nr:BamA/TamA family outer membrane protein [Novosphingobium flavum]
MPPPAGAKALRPPPRRTAWAGSTAPRGTRFSSDFAASLIALALCLAPVSARAQQAEPKLEDLIPDAAVADPEGWAGQGASAAATPEPDLDPASPLAEQPGITVPWPDDAAVTAPDTLADLPPETDVQQALGDAAAASPLASERAERGEEVRVSDNLVLVFPANLANFPEREAFLDRFRKLSTLEKLGANPDELAKVAARARSDKDLLERLMRIYGYYDAVVTQTLGNPGPDKQAAPGEVSVRFDVLPGARYRYGKVEFGNLAAAGPDYQPLRDTVEIKVGDWLDNDKIVAGRDKLDNALGEGGYAFAKVGAPDLLVDHKREEGDLTIPAEPGGKYRFGAVVSQNPGFLSSNHLEDIARFRRGDLYKRSEEEDLKRAILATGLVSAVTVTPRETAAPPAPGQAGEVALDVALTPGPLRTIAGLVGYESGDGFRLEASWEHRNLFPPEGMLRLRGIAGTKEQLIGSTVRWNNFHGRDQVLTFDVYADTVARDAYNARTLAFTTTFEKLTTLFFQKPWSWSAGLEILASAERESSVEGQFVPRNTYFIAALPLRGAIDHSDNLLDPTKGWRTSLSASPEISKQLDGPTVQYARLQFDLSAYKSVGGGVVLAGRTRVGTITGTALENIAPSRRWYAGGGGSVRGYGYQAIGPRDTAGDPSGGRSLVEFSAEARIDTGLFGGALQVVPFLDAGTVSEAVTPTLKDMRYGAGIGLRYKTGFGPLRLDLGTPLNPRSGDGRITVSVALGQAF